MMLEFLAHSALARAAAYFCLALLFVFGLTQVWRGTPAFFVAGIALVLVTPLLATYVHRVSKRR
jgi:hypothetical protein